MLERRLLVEPMKDENDRDRYLGFIATALAPSDPKRALDGGGKIGERSSTPQSVKVAIVYALGVSGRRDEAMRVIEGMKGRYAAEKYQGEAYGWLAVAVAAARQGRRRDAHRPGTDLPVDRPEDFRSWIYFGGGAGRPPGPPRAPAGRVRRTWAARYVECWPHGRRTGTATRRWRPSAQTIAAAILRSTDPGAATPGASRPGAPLGASGWASWGGLRAAAGSWRGLWPTRRTPSSSSRPS